MGTFSTKCRLTEAAVQRAQPAHVEGRARARFYLDTQHRGFGLAVSASGAKSYFVLRSINGKQIRYVFHKANEVTVAQARVQAEQILARMSLGVNPVAERRAARLAAKREQVKGITLREALALRIGTLKTKGRSVRSVEDTEYLVEKYLAAWLDRPLAELTRADVRHRHAQIAAEIAAGRHAGPKQKRGGRFGKHTANQAMRAFRSVYNRALREHPELPTNPCVNIDWYPEQQRTTTIPTGKLGVWYAGVVALPNTVRRDCLLLMLFSGLRVGNARDVRWADVDLEQRTLRIPKPKSGRPFTLPLSDVLVDLLRARRAENAKLAPRSPYVFPAASASGRIVETRAEIPGIPFTAHDLRRSFVTTAIGLGLSAYTIKTLVNHATGDKQDVTAGYYTPSNEELRAAMQRIADALRRACAGGVPDNVVPLRKEVA